MRPLASRKARKISDRSRSLTGPHRYFVLPCRNKLRQLRRQPGCDFAATVFPDVHGYFCCAATSMKFFVAAILGMLPEIALGCFGGEYYIHHQDGFAMLGIALIAIIVAIFIRITRGIRSWYLPVGVLFAAAFLPVIEWWRRGSGDCGMQFYESSVVAAGVAFSYLLYELARYWYTQRKLRQDSDA